jgi:phospholipid/cholesterol/gamma-HCH transport system substrate-binding protein
VFGAAALAGAIVTIAVIAFSGGGDPYRLRMDLANASGLRDGSDVVSGGVKVGEVHLHLGKGDRVEANLDIDRSYGPVGRDVSAAIAAANFLGRKRVELVPGDRRDRAPSGYLIPARRVTTATDLDQVLDVLDADTRTRLSILINEGGAAFTGRRVDFNQLLETLPRSEVKARALLGQLVGDNHTLADALTHSDRVLAGVAAERKALSRMVDVVGRAAAPLAERRAQLRATLARAPRTLATLQGFLGDLRRTAAPLGPAARALTASAPALSSTLAQVEPFRQSADPALRTATGVAPSLTRLAVGATPVLQRATPVVGRLAALSRDAVPVSNTLDHSVDNVLAIVQNWSRAIQFRDGLSHVFRGEALVSPETLRSLVERLGLRLDRKRRKRSPVAATRLPTTHVPALPSIAPKGTLPTLPRLPGVKLPDPKSTVSDAKKVVGQLTGSPPPSDQAHDKLLDYLLGK